MGRRSINTTKSGKYMNPTDQARKEARKKELKKNKRQRQMVRAAVLKMKDPAQILEELEKIDEMEYNVLQPSPLNEKVLKEKRKKLKETLERVLKMYDKDEPERWADLKRQEGDYERRRATLAAYHESVRHAQAVQIDDIPLPTLQVPDNLMYGNMPSQIPLPLELTPSIVPMPPPKPISILKKDTVYKELIPPALEPPGVPPFPPPTLADLSESEEMDQTEFKKPKTLRFSDQVDNKADTDMDTTEPFLEKPDREEHTRDRDDRIPDADLRPTPAPITTSTVPLSVKPTSLQQRMLALSGQNIDDFMKEMEEVHKKRELDRAADLSSRLSALERRREDTNGDNEDHPRDKDDRVAPPSMCPPGTNSSDAPAVMAPRPPPLMATLLRPPPLRPPGPPPPGMRMPSGMMPDRPAPPGPPPGLPPRLLRLPPGPPPGLPPRVLGMPRLSHPLGPHAVPLPLPVLSAAPQLINRKDGPQRGATIMAKPQIRNLSADVTRFVPSALRVKREDKKGKPGLRGPSIDIKKPADLPSKPPGAPTKDDAYMQFMREMQGLL